MTLSSAKYRGSGFNVVNSTATIPYGTVVDMMTPHEILFLQDYRSSFTGNMPPSVGPWVGSPQIVDFIANNIAIAYPKAKIGLAHFSDYPIAPYGVPGEDFVYKEIVPLTPVNETYPLEWSTYSYTNAQHGGLASVSGGDPYNCALDAITEAATSTTIGWSSPYRKILVFTDQFPHDSDLEPGVPHTNLTATMNACYNNSVYPYLFIINDDYVRNFKRYGFVIPTSPYNWGTSYNFRKSSIYTTSPDYILNYKRISETIVANYIGI